MTTDEMIEVMARAIREKDSWRNWKGESSFQDMARAALAAILPVLREDIERAHRSSQYDPAPYTKGKAAIRARFDQIAKEIKL